MDDQFRGKPHVATRSPGSLGNLIKQTQSEC